MTTTALLEVPDASAIDNRPAPAKSLKTIRVGLIGLGQVGQAVARLATDSNRLHDAGFRFQICGALVRDITRERNCPQLPRLTTNASAFLRGNYDVVIEASASIEPARSLVTRVLGRGIPVVTANKALVAAHGAELCALAARRGSWLRYEASALAGVPFLGAFAERPFVSDVDRFTAVVNGSSNFILSALEHEQCEFDDAVDRARELGLTEPDPSRDLDGVDAANKLSLLASLFGWPVPAAESLDVQGIRGLGWQDLAAAQQFGATIKPLVFASRANDSVQAFVGPALLLVRHPLAGLSGTLSGIQLSGRFVSDLFFSGPGAGPEITAATILDDAVEAVSICRRFPRHPRRGSSSVAATSPVSGWFIRARFPGIVPDQRALDDAFATWGLTPQQVSSPIGDCRWLRIAECSRGHVTRALANLKQRHRIDCHPIRAL